VQNSQSSLEYLRDGHTIEHLKKNTERIHAALRVVLAAGSILKILSAVRPVTIRPEAGYFDPVSGFYSPFTRIMGESWANPNRVTFTSKNG
jgi:hypothetical protein